MRARIPITVLTGFLGSGKTTLLNTWLADPLLHDALIIVNEVGEIGIDHQLIASSRDDVIELVSGCMCCAMKGDLIDTLADMLRQRREGTIKPFSRIIIETTGLADPVPVIQAMVTMPTVRDFELQKVVTAVDAVQGARTLSQHVEGMRQAAVADSLVITKCDLAETSPDYLMLELRHLNPGAEVLMARPGAQPHPSVLFGTALYDPSARGEDVQAWLRADRFEAAATAIRGGTLVGAHRSDITSFCLTYDEPLDWQHVATWLESLALLHGPQLLRVKGILNVANAEKPVVVQAVQQLFSRPFNLDSWPDADRRSRIVFVTQGLERTQIEDAFAQVVRSGQSAPAPA